MSKSFHYPVTAENLTEFCYPTAGHFYEAPFLWGDQVGVSNGWVALRIKTAVDCQRECPQAVQRMEQLPWSFFGKDIPDSNWGKMDDRRGGLWKHGPVQMWGEAPSGGVFAKTLRTIGVGDVTIVSQAVLQLISKLPRSEVYTSGNFNDPLFFRFNGGEGIAAGLQGEKKPPLYKIFVREAGLF